MVTQTAFITFILKAHISFNILECKSYFYSKVYLPGFLFTVLDTKKNAAKAATFNTSVPTIKWHKYFELNECTGSKRRFNNTSIYAFFQ